MSADLSWMIVRNNSSLMVILKAFNEIDSHSVSENDRSLLCYLTIESDFSESLAE